MPNTIALTEEQRDKVAKDASGEYMLSDEELEAIATRLNRFINLPFRTEAEEQIILVKIVKRIDGFLYQVLPNEIYQLVKVAHDGISPAEADEMTERLTKIANRYVDFPILSEYMEEKLLQFVISLIVRAMVTGESLATVTA